MAKRKLPAASRRRGQTEPRQRMMAPRWSRLSCVSNYPVRCRIAAGRIAAVKTLAPEYPFQYLAATLGWQSSESCPAHCYNGLRFTTRSWFSAFVTRPALSAENVAQVSGSVPRKRQSPNDYRAHCYRTAHKQFEYKVMDARRSWTRREKGYNRCFRRKCAFPSHCIVRRVKESNGDNASPG